LKPSGAPLALKGPTLQDAPFIPDHDQIPGAVNPNVMQNNIRETVCVSGWTKTVRPPTSYTENLKKRQIRELGLAGPSYHEDHVVPLCAGGHPTDPRNLWPQPLEGKWRDADKNQLEASVCRQLCRGDITLEQAQAIFLAPDWTKAYEAYFGLY
jgi:hypothetical protein